MLLKSKKMYPRNMILWILIGINIMLITAGMFRIHGAWYFMPFTVLALAIACIHLIQKKHTVLNNYPLVGSLRYLLESIRPELRQYFWESDTDGKPFNRRQRSIVYQRAKNTMETVAFGMQADPEQPGHEWVAHSAFPVHITSQDLRVVVGNEQCTQPYSLSIFNISAMSYGALSKTAITALNKGAAIGGFAHNTGEGSISPYHLSGGDLVWQIGTGYFGCRDEHGNFSPELFKENAAQPTVKMIELKLSQGAKPGHGGILPAAKNTAEIAAIRRVTPGTTVYSPPAHTAFNSVQEMISFIGSLRILSGGKPVGFKICIGDKEEFSNICQAIKDTGIIPDFITIDGSEGGTGAAPLEFTDNLGMPLYEALSFASSTLHSFGLSSKIRLIASGKIITGFDLLKAIALGASACYSARGMMFALGCIQALRCNEGKCPAGIATQEPGLYKGLDIHDKQVRIAHFHKNTLRATVEIMEACGFRTPEDVKPGKFFRKIDPVRTLSFEEIYFSKTALKHASPNNILN